ncbi:MAG: helix-turn-helix domain-containing protein [Ruthenibacterium lactatiformans]|uniref:helix-turn-helix domain-containing protein n=1 Tax=Ruthenibacterium lactatiformans TaxID=1550024 RepID=UPI0006D7741A
MSFSDEIKRIRERSFYTQEAFAKELHVAFSTVNRWEGGKARPNLTAMKSIKEFCEAHSIDYSHVEEAWLDYNREDK